MPFLLLLLTGLSLLQAAAPPAPPAPQHSPSELEQALAAAIDQPTAERRRQAADKLAKRRDVSLEQWLELLRGFGRFEDQRSGERGEVALLVEDDLPLETDLFLYVPRSYRLETPAPLMMMFHGTGGSGRGLCSYWIETAEALGMLVCAPSETGENEGYAYSQRERLAALAALRWMRRRFNVDENRIFASGISRGGHLTWDLALREPDRWAAIAPLIGGPRIQIRLGQANLRYTENIAHLPIRDLQGAQDDPRLVFNVRTIFEELAALGAHDAQLIEFEQLGHAFDFGAVDWTRFLRESVRTAAPQVVHRAAARKGEGRAFWAEISELDTRKAQETFQPKLSAAEAAELDDEGLRRAFVSMARERTARLEARQLAPGRFQLQTRFVKRVRLLLSPEMLPEDDKVEVMTGEREKSFRVRRDAQLLLREFVERFDRSFLPVAQVELRL